MTKQIRAFAFNFDTFMLFYTLRFELSLGSRFGTPEIMQCAVGTHPD